MKLNILANFIGRFWGVLSSFLFVPIYIDLLGLESYSIISFTLVLNGVMAMMDAGLTATLSREFASSFNSTQTKLRTFRTLESCYLIISSVVIVFLVLSSNYIAFNWLKLDNISPQGVSVYLRIIGVEIGLRLLGHFYSGGLIGLEKQVKSNIFQVVYGVARNGLVVFPLLISPSLQVFFIWQAIITFIYVVALRFDLSYSLSNTADFFFRKPIIEKFILFKVWRFAGGMMLISIVAGINSQMDKLALSKLLPINVLGLYTLAFALSKGISFISGPVSTAILPRMTALFTSGNHEEAVKIFKTGYLYVSIVIFSFLASMVLFSQELIWVWTNNVELAEKAHEYVPWIAAGTSFLALQNLPFNVAIANGYTKYNNVLGLSSLIITLPGYWILTDLYGGIGAAITFSFVQIIIGIIFLYLINQRFMHLDSVSLYLKNFILPILISAFISIILRMIIDFDGSRILVLLKIVSVIMCSLICNAVILLPPNNLREIFKRALIFKKQ